MNEPFGIAEEIAHNVESDKTEIIDLSVVVWLCAGAGRSDMEAVLYRIGDYISLISSSAELLVVTAHDSDYKELKRTIATYVAADNLGIKTIRSSNSDPYRALVEGVNLASGRLIVTMDGDLRYPPEAISELVDELHAGIGVVAGCRQFEGWRRISIKIINRVTSVFTGSYYRDRASRFRLFRSYAADGLKHLAGKPKLFLSPPLISGASIRETTIHTGSLKVDLSYPAIRQILTASFCAIANFARFRLRLILLAVVLVAVSVSVIAVTIISPFFISLPLFVLCVTVAIAAFLFLIGLTVNKSG